MHPLDDSKVPPRDNSRYPPRVETGKMFPRPLPQNGAQGAADDFFFLLGLLWGAT